MHVGCSCLVEGELLGGRWGGAVRRRAQSPAGVAIYGLSWMEATFALLAVIAAWRIVVEAGLRASTMAPHLRSRGRGGCFCHGSLGVSQQHDSSC